MFLNWKILSFIFKMTDQIELNYFLKYRILTHLKIRGCTVSWINEASNTGQDRATKHIYGFLKFSFLRETHSVMQRALPWSEPPPQTAPWGTTCLDPPGSNKVHSHPRYMSLLVISKMLMSTFVWTRSTDEGIRNSELPKRKEGRLQFRLEKNGMKHTAL